MAALTASATEALAPGVLRKPAVRKLGVLLLLAAVLVPFAVSRWGSGAWPGALTVDLSGPLGTASDWIVDNRDSHPCSSTSSATSATSSSSPYAPSISPSSPSAGRE